jgi:hypothetical protein
MSDEFDSPEPQQHISSFWPLLIAIVALVLFFGNQDYEINRQRGIVEQQLQAITQPVEQSRYYYARYVSLMKDLADTAQKNAIAAQIIRDAVQAGWIQVRPNATNSTDTPAAPSPSTAPSSDASH